jgi:hypothetical protein
LLIGSTISHYKLAEKLERADALKSLDARLPNDEKGMERYLSRRQGLTPARLLSRQSQVRTGDEVSRVCKSGSTLSRYSGFGRSVSIGGYASGAENRGRR